MSLTIAELVDESSFAPANDNGELVMDYTGARITGARVVLEWVARAWLTPRGVLPQARGRGIDIRQLENATLDATALERWRQAMVAEAELVEYVRRGGVAVSITRVERTIVIKATVVLVDGLSYPLAVRLVDAGKALITFGAAAA